MAQLPDAECRHGAHQQRQPAHLPQPEALEDAADLFRALGDPLRLRLLARLAEGEACVSELAELEGDKLTTVSARLQALHGVRLLRRRRQAKHVYYALWDEHVLRLVQSAIDHVAERHNRPGRHGPGLQEETMR